MAHRSEVANAVHELLSIASSTTGGIGQQISVIAREQNDNQIALQAAVQSVQGRNPIVKFFIGPNYAEVKNAQSLVSQNQAQIQQLDQLRMQVRSKVDQDKIGAQISVLAQANQSLSTELDQASAGFSLFGWLFKAI